MRVAIVGTGEMGRPLVDRLLGAGHEVRAYTRREQVRQDLESVGASSVDRLEQLAEGTDVLLVYVYTDRQVREVVLDSGLADRLAPGSCVAVLTTGSPRIAEELAERLLPRGVGVVDAPASGGPSQVADGSLTVFVGGTERDVERCRPVLATYAARIEHAGPVGSGQRVKLLNNLLFGAHVELAVEASRLAEAFGIEPAVLARSLRGCSGASYALELVALMGSAQGLIAGAGPYVRKDVQTAVALAQELGASLGTFAAVVAPLIERTRPH